MAKKAFFAFTWVWGEVGGPLAWFLYTMFQQKPAFLAKYLGDFKSFAQARLTKAVWLVLGDWFNSLPASHPLVKSAKTNSGGSQPLQWSPTGDRSDPQWQPWQTAKPWSLTVAEWLAAK